MKTLLQLAQFLWSSRNILDGEIIPSRTYRPISLGMAMCVASIIDGIVGLPLLLFGRYSAITPLVAEFIMRRAMEIRKRSSQ